MTKAIDYFKRKIETENQICNLPTCDDEVKVIKQEHIAYMQSAIAALEKQIPKEPEHKYITGMDDKIGFYCCPLCDYHPLYINMKYCIKCGQAIKWE